MCVRWCPAFMGTIDSAFNILIIFAESCKKRFSKNVHAFTRPSILYYIKPYSIKEDRFNHIQHAIPHFIIFVDKKLIWRGWLKLKIWQHFRHIFTLHHIQLQIHNEHRVRFQNLFFQLQNVWWLREIQTFLGHKSENREIVHTVNSIITECKPSLP